MNRKEVAVCPNCEITVLTSYVRRNNGTIRQWAPIGFYCDGCEKFITNDEVVYHIKQNYHKTFYRREERCENEF